MKTKVLLLALLSGFVFSVSAQEFKPQVGFSTEKGYKTNFKKNKAGDNWFISVAGGASMLLGAEETTTAEMENAAAESTEPAIAVTENQNEDFNLDDLIAEYSGEQPAGFVLTDEQENTVKEAPAAEMTTAPDESEDGNWEGGGFKTFDGNGHHPFGD